MDIINRLLCILFISSPLYACPTCVGRVAHDSPLFFSEEFYKKEVPTISKNFSYKNNIPSDKKNKEHQS